jgi:hypothetical protein
VAANDGSPAPPSATTSASVIFVMVFLHSFAGESNKTSIYEERLQQRRADVAGYEVALQQSAQGRIQGGAFMDDLRSLSL